MTMSEKVEYMGELYPGEKIKEWTVINKRTGKGFKMILYRIQLPNGEYRTVKKAVKQ